MLRALVPGIVLLTLWLAACTGQDSTPSSADKNEQVFRPPTADLAVTPLITPQPAPVTPSPTVTRISESPSSTPLTTCTDNLAFLQDISIPDGTRVEPGEGLDKRWQVQNSGSCNWNEGYTLQLTAGPALGAAEQQAVYPARSGTEAIIRILFTAPEEAGTYRSAWQAHNPQGEPFGDPFFIEIVVVAAAP